MIELKNVSLAYGDKQVLRDFSLSLPLDRVTCLLGPSGCGKTTLLRVAAGLLIPDAGTVARPEGMRASFIFQEDRLLPWLDALGNLTAVGIAEDAALRALSDVRLNAEARAMPDALSGGMQRRLAIARAIAFGGDYFFMDEPLRGLDAATAAPVLRALRVALASHGGLLITHDRQEAEALGEMMLALDGPPVRVISARAHQPLPMTPTSS